MRKLALVLAVTLTACGAPEETPSVTIAQYRSGLTMSGAGGCDTGIASGLSRQLIEELNCVQPNLMTNFSGPNVTTYSSVWPYLAPAAARDLKDATVAMNDSITISSAYRTLAQQYLLYRWWQRGQCGIQVAATPGSSNHQSGRAIDTPYYSFWRSALTAQGWRWLGSSDLVHFDHLASPDTSSKSVLAFQRLWNKNHSSGRLAEDGDWGPATEGAMAQTPTTGFSTHGCPTTGTLAGTITDRATGTALSGVAVKAGSATSTTAANGKFSLTLPPGAVSVTATKTGYVTASLARTVVLGSTVDASLALTAVVSSGTLHGVVTNSSSGAPVADATVSARGQSVRTSATGAWQLTQLAAGATSVSVSAMGFAMTSVSAQVVAGGNTTVNVALVPAAGNVAPTVELQSALEGESFTVALVTLSGEVRDDEPGATLFVTLNGGASTEVPLMDGHFDAALHLAPGENVARLVARDARGVEASVEWRGSFRAGFAGLVHRFDDASGGVSGAVLELFDPDTGMSLGRTTSADDGRFELLSARAGIARLEVTRDGFTPREQLVDVSPDEQQVLDVALTTGAEVGLRFLEPTSEGPFDAAELRVAGVVTGLEVTRVTVNGVEAALVGNGFVVTLPLPEGRTEFVAVAENGEGVTVTGSVFAARAMKSVKGGCSSAPGVLVLAVLAAFARRRARR